MHNTWFFIPFGIVFAAIGAFNLINPSLAFRMRMWQFKNKEALEPSNGALIVGRVSGGVAVVVGIGLVIFGIMSMSR